VYSSSCEPDADPLGTTDHRLRRHPNIVEIHVGRPRAELAHLVVARAHSQARRVTRHQERRDAAGRPGLRVGTREDHEHVRDRRVRDVALRAVQHPAVTDGTCGGGQSGRVRSGLGLGEGERRGDLAARDARQPALLLLLRTALEQHVARDAVVGPEHRAQRRRGVAERSITRRLPSCIDSPSPPYCSGMAKPNRRITFAFSRIAVGTSSFSSISGSSGTTSSRTNSRTVDNTYSSSAASKGFSSRYWCQTRNS